MNNIDNYIQFHASVIKEGIDNGDIQINDNLLHDYKEGVINLCLILKPNISRTEIGLLVDKIFANVLGYE